MSMLLSAFEKAMGLKHAYTANGAVSLATPDKTGVTEGRVSLFFKSIRGIEENKLQEYLQKSYIENSVDTFVLAFNCRDPRGGKGERDIGRKMLRWLFSNYPAEFRKILNLIPEYGRWDDLLTFFPNVIKVENEKQKQVQIEIIKFLCDKLIEDKKLMEEGKPISICAKWAPTERDSDDKKYKLVDTICDHLKISKKNYRKEYISPLRAYLEIVERYMCLGRWDDITYSRVPSKAMKNLKKAFEKHSPDSFQDWKISLSKGEVKVNAKVLHPHEIIRELRTKGYSDEISEAQWKVLEDEVEKCGVLENVCIVCDTSSSMENPNHLPIDNAVALGLIISKAVKGEFNGNVITFNDVPEFVKIYDGTLFERFTRIRNIAWGGSTNIQKTFDLILERGKDNNLTDKEMPKKIIIVSDMQFNQVESYIRCGKTTNFQEIDRKYKESGFTRPQIIFWNVNGSSDDFPVDVDDNGTCLVSGSSPSILKSIITAKDFSSYGILRMELDSKRYAIIRKKLE